MMMPFAMSAAVGDVPNGLPVLLNLCDPTKALQQWEFRNGSLVLRQYTDRCLDITNLRTDDEAPVEEWPCHPDDKDPTHQNQVRWKITWFGNFVANYLCVPVCRLGSWILPPRKYWLPEVQRATTRC